LEREQTLSLSSLFVFRAEFAGLTRMPYGLVANLYYRFRVRNPVHDLKRDAEEVAVAVKRINDVSRHRKLGRVSYQIQSLCF
jgi:hypothetical protein